MTPMLSRLAPALAALLLIAACAEKGADVAGADTPPAADAAQDEAPAAAGDDASAATPAALDAAALDALVRGIERENTMLEDVAGRVAKAETDMAKLEAMGDAQPAALEAAGAEAAGMDVARYRHIKDQLFTVVGMVEMRAALEQQFAAIDTTGMDAETAAQAQKNADEMRAQLSDPYADVDAATAEAIRARQAELAELRARHIGLLFKAAGG